MIMYTKVCVPRENFTKMENEADIDPPLCSQKLVNAEVYSKHSKLY